MTAAIDPRELRKALGAFVTGVTVITTREADGTPRGFTANSFTSVSLDPPLILVCIGKTAFSYPVFCAAKNFAVNILAEDQVDTSGVFASKEPDKFDRARWRTGAGGSPIIEDTTAWLDCETHDLVEAGDHVILIGRVIDFDHSNANPLGFCRGSYVQFGLERDAVAAAGQQTRVGAILESDGKILMLKDPQSGTYVLPTGSSLGSADDEKSLYGKVRALGVGADISFLFAVYESDNGNCQWVYYRGEIVYGPKEDPAVRMFGFDEMPWDKITDSALQTMLRRYVTERTENRFGIYVGDNERGQIHALSESYF